MEEQRKRNEEVRDMPELVRDFLDPGEFFRQVKTICGIEFFCGVPDSLLKGKTSSQEEPVKRIGTLDFCAYVTKNVPSSQHMITVNEGSAVGLACGSYMATGKPSLVYLQVGRAEGKEREFHLSRGLEFGFGEYRQSDHVFGHTGCLQSADVVTDWLARRAGQT